VLTAINLDYEPRLQADQIDDVRSHWQLTAESVAVDLLTSQPHPETELGVGHFGA
jgi:hypothetical protein